MLWFDGDVPSGGNVDFHCDVYRRWSARRVVFAEPDGGYADHLRALTPEEVTGTAEQTGTGIVISFASGRLILHPAAAELVGPEIAMLSGFADGSRMVWRPGEESFEDLA